MICEDCGAKLKVVRRCRQVRLKCDGCGREFQVHEVADRLDAETEEILANSTSIIYD
jgi:predicted amidophosphoribosyltransferase